MPTVSGIEILEKTQHLDILTILLTAHPEYAIDAIKLSAFDYILKPISLNEINRVSSKIESVLQQNGHSEDQIIRIKVSNVFHFLKQSEITHASSEGNYTSVYMSNGKPLVITKNLKKIQQEYLKDFPFFRIHQSHIINLNSINTVSAKAVTLDNGITLPISKNTILP